MTGMKDEMNSWEKHKQVIGKFWLLQIVVVAWQSLSVVFKLDVRKFWKFVVQVKNIG